MQFLGIEKHLKLCEFFEPVAGFLCGIMGGISFACYYVKKLDKCFLSHIIEV